MVTADCAASACSQEWGGEETIPVGAVLVVGGNRALVTNDGSILTAKDRLSSR